MIARNFKCPETDEPCVRPSCSKARCVDAVRRREVTANKKIRSETMPAYRGTIAPWRWYTLRNGEIVTITRKDSAIWKDANGDIQKAFFWVGAFTSGEKAIWQLDGYVSPVAEGRPHQNDIIGTAVRP